MREGFFEFMSTATYSTVYDEDYEDIYESLVSLQDESGTIWFNTYDMLRKGLSDAKQGKISKVDMETL